jgi:DtxR family transcriptional regulator, Mn-dependent transcriptional regulator
MLTSTVEDYLKTFLKMEDLKQRASTSNVARHLDVADASVTDMLRKLQKAGLLEYRPYYGAALTEKGRGAALKILRRHRLLELFLHQVMGYGWEQVHDEAENLEHVVTDFFVERVDALLNHPVQDPHGEVIPDAQGYRNPESDMCLAEAETGVHIIHRITKGEPAFLEYLEKEGMVPSCRFTLLERVPFDGPLKVLLAARKEPQYIGLEASRSIFVKPVVKGFPSAGKNRAARRRSQLAGRDESPAAHKPFSRLGQFKKRALPDREGETQSE